MYAQTFEGGGAQTDRLNQAICRELLPALRGERGFSGAVSLIDPKTDAAVVLVFWATKEEAASPLPPYFASFLTELGVADPATYTPRIWEVGARA